MDCNNFLTTISSLTLYCATIVLCGVGEETGRLRFAIGREKMETF
jgi:hypothetical protein